MQSSTNSSTMELAYNELSNTIKEATEYSNQDEKHPKHLKIHIDALTENIDMLLAVKSDVAVTQIQAMELTCKARRLRRSLERDLIEISVDASSTTPSPPPIAPSRSATLSPTPLQLPVFDGNMDEFYDFSLFFKENILDNEDLTDLVKMLYLKQCLKGYPAELLSTMPLTSQALQASWKLLSDLYGGSKLLVHFHIKVQNFPPSNMNTECLRSTHTELEKMLLLLSHLGHQVETDRYIRCVYLRKFPFEIIYEAHKSQDIPSKDIPFKELRAAISQIITAREGVDQLLGIRK